MEDQQTKEIFDYLKKLEIEIQDGKCEIIEAIKEIKQLKLLETDNMIGTKVHAAKVAGCSAQHITSLIEKGHIINYGVDGDYRFRRSELKDMRKVCIENN